MLSIKGPFCTSFEVKANFTGMYFIYVSYGGSVYVKQRVLDNVKYLFLILDIKESTFD